MQYYEMVNEAYGNVPGETDTLDNWKQQLTELCETNGWPVPQLDENSYGDIVDRSTGETVLQPVQEWQEV